MKHLSLAGIEALILAVVVVGAGRVAAADLQDVYGLYPNSVQIMNRHLILRSASKELISETDTYQPTDALAAVLTRYIGRYQPEPGEPKLGECVLLRRAMSYLMFRETVLVTLRPSGNGTRVVLFRDLRLVL